jgi:hypothetical protein
MKVTKATFQNIRAERVMGTTQFEMKAGNMRKAQNFIVYPIAKDGSATEILIQSDHRMARISLETGNGILSAQVANYPSRLHLSHGVRYPFTVDAVDLAALKMQIFTSGNAKAGGNGVVFTDNSGAFRVF